MSETGNNSPTKAGTLSDRVRSLRLTESNETPPEGGRWWWLPWTLCGLLFFTTSLLALEAFAPIDDEMIKKLAEERGLNVGKGASPSSTTLANLGVTRASGDAGTLEIALTSKGNIVPISLIQVSPKISGTVMRLNFKEGDEIMEDFLLAELEDVEFRSDRDRVLAGKEIAERRLGELKNFLNEEIEQSLVDWKDTIAQKDQAFAKYQRYVALRQRGSVSPEDLELSKSNYDSFDFRARRLELTYKMMKETGKGPRYEKIAGAEAEIRQAHAELDKAEWRLANCKVRAPKTSRGNETVSYIVLSKKTEEGNIVNPSAFSNGLSASLCEMADLYKMEVDLSIAERDIAKLYKDQECRIQPEAFPNRIYKGVISRIMPMADRSKSSVPVRVKIEFPAIDNKGQALPMEMQGEYLRPEMGAIVTFLNRKVMAK